MEVKVLLTGNRVGLPQIPCQLLATLHSNAAEVSIKEDGSELRYSAGANAEEERVLTLGEIASSLEVPVELARWAYHGLFRARFIVPHDDRVKYCAFGKNGQDLLHDSALFKLARVEGMMPLPTSARSFEEYFPPNRYGAFDEVTGKLLRLIEILEKLIDKDPEGGWFKTRGKFVKAISTHAGKGVFSDPFIMSGLQFLTDMGILERKGESKHFWRFYPGVQSAGYLKAYDEPMPWYNNLSMVDVHADPDQERIFNLTQASAATLRQMRRALAAQEKDHKKLLESSRRIKTAFDERKSALSDIGLS